MARSLNKVMLIGNLGADPELRHTAGGLPVATFSLATNWSSRGSESGPAEEKTEWHNIVVFKRLAEICQQYLNKGSKVYLEGRIQTRSWDDAKTGQKRYMTEIVANQMIMLDPPGASRGGSPQRAEAQRPATDGDEPGSYPDTDDFDDDLPF